MPLYKGHCLQQMPWKTYTLEKLKQSETKMHARDIIRRQQEAIELLMAEKAAAEARIRQLENELLLHQKN